MRTKPVTYLSSPSTQPFRRVPLLCFGSDLSPVLFVFPSKIKTRISSRSICLYHHICISFLANFSLLPKNLHPTLLMSVPLSILALLSSLSMSCCQIEADPSMPLDFRVYDPSHPHDSSPLRVACSSSRLRPSHTLTFLLSPSCIPSYSLTHFFTAMSHEPSTSRYDLSSIIYELGYCTLVY